MAVMTGKKVPVIPQKGLGRSCGPTAGRTRWAQTLALILLVGVFNFLKDNPEKALETPIMTSFLFYFRGSGNPA